MIGHTGVLAAAIRIDDQTRRRLSLFNSHVQCVADQFRWHAWCHRPAKHLARVEVHHDGQLQPSCTGADIRDVADIRPVAGRWIELAIQYIGGDRQVMLVVRRVDELALPN